MSHVAKCRRIRARAAPWQLYREDEDELVGRFSRKSVARAALDVGSDDPMSHPRPRTAWESLAARISSLGGLEQSGDKHNNSSTLSQEQMRISLGVSHRKSRPTRAASRTLQLLSSCESACFCQHRPEDISTLFSTTMTILLFLGLRCFFSPSSRLLKTTNRFVKRRGVQ